jgi:hypothetical protein
MSERCFVSLEADFLFICEGFSAPLESSQLSMAAGGGKSICLPQGSCDTAAVKFSPDQSQRVENNKRSNIIQFWRRGNEFPLKRLRSEKVEIHYDY